MAQEKQAGTVGGTMILKVRLERDWTFKYAPSTIEWFVQVPAGTENYLDYAARKAMAELPGWSVLQVARP